MNKLLLFGILAGALLAAAPARAGGYFSVQVGLPAVSVLLGGSRVLVQAAPVAVGVNLSTPVCLSPSRVQVPRRSPAPVPAARYQGPYPSYIAPPYHP